MYELKMTSFILCLVFIAGFIMPLTVKAKEENNKTVRVGWFDSPFNYLDSSGRSSGYAYEYQQKIASYTGWKYEYVEGSFPELMEKLESGEIDLMSDVSYTEERAADMLFSSLPMGEEEYYIFISASNTQIKAGGTASISGKKIGVNKDSYQEMLFLEWIKKNNVDAEIVELMCSQDESIQMLKEGKIDAFITIDIYIESNLFIPAFKIGKSEFYFAVNKNREDLLSGIDLSMGKFRTKTVHIISSSMIYMSGLRVSMLISICRSLNGCHLMEISA